MAWAIIENKAMVSRGLEDSQTLSAQLSCSVHTVGLLKFHHSHKFRSFLWCGGTIGTKAQFSGVRTALGAIRLFFGMGHNWN